MRAQLQRRLVPCSVYLNDGIEVSDFGEQRKVE